MQWHSARVQVGEGWYAHVPSLPAHCVALYHTHTHTYSLPGAVVLPRRFVRLLQARVLNSVIKPALEKIKASMKEANPDRPQSDLALISELSKAFELAETSKSGICESITEEICTTMLR